MRLAATVLALLLPQIATAQVAANLLADIVSLRGENTLIASGNVEVFYGDSRLTATRIVYSQNTDQLSIEGPIFITGPDGEIFMADSAEIDPKLENGILLGARLVLDERLQLAAARIDTSPTASQLTRVAATSCSVCDGRPPLWDIRAGRVTHDQEAQQLYFEDATFRVRGVPLVWLPKIRMPDPSLERATGLLIPRYRSTDQLGFGVKLPYFIALDDDRDVTITPYLSLNTVTVEGRYRQAFANGDLLVEGALSSDNQTDDALRGYIRADAEFWLPSGYTLTFDGTATTDDGYLQTYGYSDADRLESTLRFEKVEARTLAWAEISAYQTLLDDENNAGLPPLVAEARYEESRDLWGGLLTIGADGDLFLRYGEDTGGLDRDVFRVGAEVDWVKDYVLSSGLLIRNDLGLRADWYVFNDEPQYDSGVRFTPEAAVTLSYPMIRTGAKGVTDIIEPKVMVGWTGDYGTDIPNEDSTSVEFDESNLFSLSRFPGEDRIEPGLQAAAGLSWSRTADNGLSARFVLGRVFRNEAADFTASSGLSGTASDWLVAGQFMLPDGIGLAGRSVLDDNFTPSKSEIAIDWNGIKMDLAASYVFLDTDLAENRDGDVSEWAVDAEYRFDDIWTLGVNGRYDVAAEAPAEAGFDIGWQNECVTVEFSASRRYTSSSSVEPTTDYGLSIGLTGFGTSASGAAARRTCTK
ncbi:LPS-assembly protein LptD [Marivivens donghaensis]|uniref:LPS-assembly protein LptD n=1 Tax=Marivivens donghaensis TaxID=1699413 RepID=A0ABX0W150_9RHOB|nr:LPS assembly protein LptD [Marivivens donghaensis]NIY72954.1 LPS-assembly protein LptD [Marivivens donghaensis]